MNLIDIQYPFVIVMVMASTIQEVLRPIFFMYFIIGIGVYPKQSKSKIQRIMCLSIVYSLIIWFAYGYLLYHTIVIFTLGKLYRSSVTANVLKISIVIAITCVIMNFFYQKVLLLYDSSYIIIAIIQYVKKYDVL